MGGSVRDVQMIMRDEYPDRYGHGGKIGEDHQHHRVAPLRAVSPREETNKMTLHFTFFLAIPDYYD